MQLEEKQIPYTLEKINMRCYGPKPPSYSAKVTVASLQAPSTRPREYIRTPGVQCIVWPGTAAFPACCTVTCMQ